MTKRITLRHFATVKSLTIFTGEVKLFLKQASQVNTAAKSRLLGDTIQRLVSLLKTPPRGGGRASATYRAGEAPVSRVKTRVKFRGLMATFRQLIYAEVGGGFSEQPRQQIVNRAWWRSAEGYSG